MTKLWTIKPDICDNIVTMPELAPARVDRSKQVVYNIMESKHNSFKDYEVIDTV